MFGGQRSTLSFALLQFQSKLLIIVHPKIIAFGHVASCGCRLYKIGMKKNHIWCAKKHNVFCIVAIAKYTSSYSLQQKLELLVMQPHVDVEAKLVKKQSM